MIQHLSTEQITEWVIGVHSRDVEEHLRKCRFCADEVQRFAEPLKMFGGAVRSWSEEVSTAPIVLRKPTRRWRMAFIAAAALLMIAAPVYRREEMKRQAAQDELLLRQVEAGISRSVPAPMETLARLMSIDKSEESK